MQLDAKELKEIQGNLEARVVDLLKRKVRLNRELEEVARDEKAVAKMIACNETNKHIFKDNGGGMCGARFEEECTLCGLKRYI